MALLKAEICCICQRSIQDDVILYPVPKASYRRKKWISSCGINFAEGDLVCEFHFTEKDFRFHKSQRMLQVKALPTLNLHENSTAQKEVQHEVALIEITPDLVTVDALTPYELINEELFDDKTCSLDYCSKTVQTGSENSRYCGLIELVPDTEMYSINCFHCLEKFALASADLFVAHIEHSHNILLSTKLLKESSKDSSELRIEKDTTTGSCRKIAEVNTNLVDIKTEDRLKKEEIKETSDDKEPMWSGSEQSSSSSSDENDEEYVPLQCSKKKKRPHCSEDTVEDSNSYDRSEEYIIIGKTDHGIVMDFLDLLKLHPNLCSDSKPTKLDCDNAMQQVLEALNEKWPNFQTTKKSLRRSITRLKIWHKRRLYAYKRKTKIECRRQHRIYFDKCAQILTNTVLKHTSTPFACDLCESIFLFETDFKLHRYMQHNLGELPHACTQCEQRFESSKLAVRHMRDVHKIGQREKFPCPECSNRYNSDNMLQSHIRKKHSGNNESFVCDVCGKSFSRRGVLNRHRTSHEPPKLECSICKMRFMWRQNLKDHLKTHFNQRDQICTICGRAFVRRRNLLQHYKVHSKTK